MLFLTDQRESRVRVTFQKQASLYCFFWNGCLSGTLYFTIVFIVPSSPAAALLLTFTAGGKSMTKQKAYKPCRKMKLFINKK
jgi:hypothetical protein